MRPLHSLPGLLGTLLVLGLGPAAVPARAELVAISLSGTRLLVEGIPIPEGAETSLMASLSFDNLRILAPRAGALGQGRLRAVVYEMPDPAPPEAVAAYYRRELPAAVPPAVGEAGGANGKEPTDNRMRVLRLPARGYLAVRSEEVTGPARVTVAMVEGTAEPTAVLKAVDELRTGGDEPAPDQTPALLSPHDWEIDSTFQQPQLRMLLSHALPGDAPGPVIDVYRSLLTQARVAILKKYRAPGRLPASGVLPGFAGEARRSHWRLLSVEAETPQQVTMLYRFPDDRGMVMLRAEPGALQNVAPADSPVGILERTTQITRFEVRGPIKVRDLFRPIPPVPVPSGNPLRLLPIPGVRSAPRGPILAQPHRR